MRPFPNSNRKWALPCYPILDVYNKNNNQQNINIAIIGHTNNHYRYNIINRLKGYDNKNITIHFISRKVSPSQIKGLNPSFTIKLFKNIDFLQTIKILSYCDFVFINATINKNYITDNMTGAIPLALSTLTPMIICKQQELYYKFQNVIEYDINTMEDIQLKKMDTNLLCEEREGLIKAFSSHVDEYVDRTNETITSSYTTL